MESWNSIDVRRNPLYVILDLGCTKSMGSRQAVNAFCYACEEYGMWTEFLPTESYFSFANSNTTRVWEKCRVWFPTNPPCSTTIEICEEGNAPILLSLPTMRNLSLTVELSPAAVLLTCPVFGYKQTPAVMASSQHIVLNLAELKENPLNLMPGKNRVSDQSSFLAYKADNMTEDIPLTLSRNCLACQGVGKVHSYAGDCAKVCPACEGKHRSHTYEEGCKKFGEEKPNTGDKEKEGPPVTRKRALGDPDLKVDSSGVNKRSSSSSSSAHPEPQVEEDVPPVPEAELPAPPVSKEEDVKRALRKKSTTSSKMKLNFTSFI